MEEVKYVFENNGNWIKQQLDLDADYFKSLESGQQPEFMWIGCSDSRILPNEMTGIGAGGMFVHRNIANLVQHNDINLLAVLQYAIDVLKVKHLVICGHYGCGGVQAALGQDDLGIIDIWIRQIKDLAAENTNELMLFSDPKDKAKRLVELNVLQQAENLNNLPVVQKAKSRGQELHIHPWVFDFTSGKLIDLTLVSAD